MSKMNKRTFARILLILVIVLAVVGFYFIPRIRSKVTQVLMLFRSMSVESIVGYLRSFGVWAVVISFLLDKYGSFILQQIDGKRTVKEIGENLGSAIEEANNQLYDRLLIYLHHLEKNEKYIELV